MSYQIHSPPLGKSSNVNTGAPKFISSLFGGRKKMLTTEPQLPNDMMYLIVYLMF